MLLVSLVAGCRRALVLSRRPAVGDKCAINIHPQSFCLSSIGALFGARLLHFLWSPLTWLSIGIELWGVRTKAAFFDNNRVEEWRLRSNVRSLVCVISTLRACTCFVIISVLIYIDALQSVVLGTPFRHNDRGIGAIPIEGIGFMDFFNWVCLDPTQLSVQWLNWPSQLSGKFF